MNAVAIGANDLTINNKLGDLTANLKLTATANGAASAAQTKLVGVGTLNVESAFSGTGAQATANSFTLTANSDNTIINLKGAQAVTLGGVAAATTGSTIDGSALTGKLTVSGSSKSDIIKGGAAADAITTTGGNDTVTGGAGADAFIFAGGDAVVTDVANVNTITDFTTTSDKLTFKTGADASLTGLTFTAGTTVTLNTAQTIATAADLAAVYAGITAIGASTGAAVQAAIITVSAGAAAGTYVYVDGGTAGVTAADDLLIKITGTVVAGDFAFVA